MACREARNILFPILKMPSSEELRIQAIQPSCKNIHFVLQRVWKMGGKNQKRNKNMWKAGGVALSLEKYQGPL